MVRRGWRGCSRASLAAAPPYHLSGAQGGSGFVDASLPLIGTPTLTGDVQVGNGLVVITSPEGGPPRVSVNVLRQPGRGLMAFDAMPRYGWRGGRGPRG
jgi:hypothetical protein